MNELTQNIQKMMVPKAAIIAYKYEDRRNSDTRYFIELRPIGKFIDIKKNKYVIQPIPIRLTLRRNL